MPHPPTLLEQLAEMERRERLSPPYPLYRKPNPELFKVLAKLREVVEAVQHARTCPDEECLPPGQSLWDAVDTALSPMKEA